MDQVGHRQHPEQRRRCSGCGGNSGGQKAGRGDKIPLKSQILVLRAGEISLEAAQAALAVNLAGAAHSLSMDASLTAFAHSSSSFSLLSRVTAAFSGRSRRGILLIPLPAAAWPQEARGRLRPGCFFKDCLAFTPPEHLCIFLPAHSRSQQENSRARAPCGPSAPQDSLALSQICGRRLLLEKKTAVSGCSPLPCPSLKVPTPCPESFLESGFAFRSSDRSRRCQRNLVAQLARKYLEIRCPHVSDGSGYFHR